MGHSQEAHSGHLLLLLLQPLSVICTTQVKKETLQPLSARLCLSAHRRPSAKYVKRLARSQGHGTALLHPLDTEVCSVSPSLGQPAVINGWLKDISMGGFLPAL